MTSERKLSLKRIRIIQLDPSRIQGSVGNVTRFFIEEVNAAESLGYQDVRICSEYDEDEGGRFILWLSGSRRERPIPGTD